MRFALIFEAVDRASKAVRGIGKSVQAANAAAARGAEASARASRIASRAAGDQGRAAERVARATEATVRAARSATSAVDGEAAARHRAATATERQIEAMERFGRLQGERIRTGAGKAVTGGGKVIEGARRAGRTATGIVAGGGLFGFGAGMAVRGMVRTAAEFERFETVLTTIEGSSAAAKRSMDWITTFAAKTPYDLAGVTEAYVKLRAYGIDPTSGTLQSLGNAAAALDKPLMQAVEAVADAMMGENERLKEFGIAARKVGKEFVYTFTGSDGRQKQIRALANDKRAIEQALRLIFDSRYAGAMDRLSQTFEGMTSNLLDAWDKVAMAIMNAGLFDWIKGKLSDLLSLIDRMAADGSLAAWASEFSAAVVSALEKGWEIAKGFWAAMQGIAAAASAIAAAVGGWENFAYLAVLLMFVPALAQIASGLAAMAGGLWLAASGLGALAAMAARIGVFTAFGSALTTAGRAAAAFAALLWPAFTVAAGAIASFSIALLASPITWMVAGVAALAAAAWWLYANWDGVGQWFADLWAGMKQVASDAWTALTGFDWGSLVPDIDWGSLVPDFAWEDLIPDIDWQRFIPVLDLSALAPTADWAAIGTAITDALTAAFEAIAEVWSWIQSLFDWSPLEAIRATFGPIAETIGGYLADAAAVAGEGWTALTSIFSEEAAVDIALRDPASLERASSAVQQLSTDLAALERANLGAIGTAIGGVRADVGKVIADISGVQAAARAAVMGARGELSGVSFFTEGVALMSTLAAGIRAGSAEAVSAVRATAQAMRDHLPHSPAKTGPLSDLHRVRFSETLASAIRPAPAIAAVARLAGGMRAALSPPAAPLSAGLAPGGGGVGSGVTIHAPMTVTVSGAGRDAEAGFARQLSAHADHIQRLVDEAIRRRQRLAY